VEKTTGINWLKERYLYPNLKEDFAVIKIGKNISILRLQLKVG